MPRQNGESAGQSDAIEIGASPAIAIPVFP